MIGVEIKDGIYPGMPYDVYATIPAINYSILKYFGQSAAHAQKQMLRPKKPTEAMEFGTDIHCAIFEPKRFAAEYVSVPKLDMRTKVGKAAWAKHEKENVGKNILFDADYAACLGMQKRVDEHEGIAALLRGEGGINELTIVWTDPETGERCKSRIDRLGTFFGDAAMGDLKSTTQAEEWAFSSQATKLKYYVQSAMYKEGLNILVPKERRFFTVAIEKEDPWGMCLYELDDDSMAAGMKRFREYLEKYSIARKSNNWPNYPSTLIPLRIKNYALKGIIKTGE